MNIEQSLNNESRIAQKKSARNNESLSSNYSDSTPDDFRIKSLFCARNGSKKLYSTVSFQNFGRRKGFTSTFFAYRAFLITLAFIPHEIEAGRFSATLRKVVEAFLLLLPLPSTKVEGCINFNEIKMLENEDNHPLKTEKNCHSFSQGPRIL